MKRLPGRRGLLAIAAVSALIGVVMAGMSSQASAGSNVGAPVHQAQTNHTITVAGHGDIQVAPDESNVTLGVQTKAQDAQQAMQANAAKMNAVIAAIEAQGIPEKNIQTSDLSLYHDDQADVFVANHQVTVTIDTISKTGAVIDAAVSAGANNSWGVSFDLKDPSGAKSQALQSAVADARKRADAMATALGVTITGVGSASEATYNVVPIAYAKSAAVAQPSASTPVEAGQLDVSADIQVVYTFS